MADNEYIEVKTNEEQPEKKQNRFKSWALWVSIAGAVWTILSAFEVPQKAGITSETFMTVLNAVGGILIAFGIVNNPTDKENF